MAGPLRILYLIENADSADAVAARLADESQRIVVDAERQPDEWLARVDAGDGDVLLVDDGVTSEDGYAVLERVRDVDPDVPVILTIGEESETHPGEALASGASDYAYLADGQAAYEALATRIENAAGRYGTANGAAPAAGDVDPWQVGNAPERSGGERDRERVQDIFEELGTSFFTTDDYGEYTYVNPAGSGITGYDPGEVVGSDPSLLFDTEDVERLYRTTRDLIRNDAGNVGTVEASLETKSGERLPVEVTIGIRTDEEGRFRGTVGVMRDVTDQKAIERRLHERRTIMRAVPDELAVIDTDGVMTDVIPPTGSDRTMTGYDPAELVGEHVTRVISDEAFEESLSVVEGLVESGREHDTIEIEFRCRDGERFTGETHVALMRDGDGAIRGLISVLRDVEDRKERERELERYETLLELMPDTVVVTDLQGNLLDVHGYEGWSGYTEGDIVDDHMDFAITPESVERAEEVVADIILNDDEETATFEMEIETSDGRVIPFEDHITVLPPDEDGEIPGTMSVLRNIEKREQRERELRRYASLVEATGDAVYALDAGGRFTFSNEAHQEIVDRPESEILGAHASIALPDEAVEGGRALISELLEGDRRCGTYEMEVLRPDGERIPTENHVALLTDEDGEFRGTVGVLRDISERLERERELQRQNERLEKFASITSHDLRNPLNLAQGYLDLVARDCDTEHTETIEGALERMEQLIEDTLTWARQGGTVDERERIDLASLVPECWEAVGTRAGTVTTVGDVAVDGDPDRVRRLLENLLRNSVEHGGDDVTVEIGAIEGQGGSDGRNAGFYVEDEGPGIPPDDRDSVFEAGLTTAADGTGFGLAIVTEICEAHGWEIDVTDGEVGGARFEITGVRRP